MTINMNNPLPLITREVDVTGPDMAKAFAEADTEGQGEFLVELATQIATWPARGGYWEIQCQNLAEEFGDEQIADVHSLVETLTIYLSTEMKHRALAQERTTDDLPATEVAADNEEGILPDAEPPEQREG